MKEKLEEEEEAAAAMEAWLPDDMVLEILGRLKNAPDVLFRCATACKPWRDLVADLAFLRRCLPQNAPTSLVGFIVRQRLQEEEGTEWILPSPRSPLGRGVGALTSFVPAGAAPLVSRHGLLLVHLNARLIGADPNLVQLAICNLQLGTCHMLPVVSFCTYEYKANSYAVLTAQDYPPHTNYSSSSSFFKVVIIGYNERDLKYNLCTYSSDETSWSVRRNCFESTALLASNTLGYFSDASVCRGNIHWIFVNRHQLLFYVVNLNIQNQDISLSNLPFPLSSVLPSYSYYRCCPCLILAHQEALWLLCMQRSRPVLEIWGKQGNNGWFCTRTIRLKQPGKKNLSKRRELCLLGEKCGTLLLGDSRRCVYTARIKTGTIETLLESHTRPWEVVPVEMDLPELFVSRLSTRKA